MIVFGCSVHANGALGICMSSTSVCRIRQHALSETVVHNTRIDES